MDLESVPSPQLVPPDSLTLHPAHVWVPPMRPEEWRAFLDDIKTNGIQTPLQVDAHRRVLDGVHRLQAAKALHLPAVPVVGVTLPDGDDATAIAFVLRAAIHRRQLTDDQRAVLAAQIATVLANRRRAQRAATAAAARWGKAAPPDAGAGPLGPAAHPGAVSADAGGPDTGGPEAGGAEAPVPRPGGTPPAPHAARGGTPATPAPIPG